MVGKETSNKLLYTITQDDLDKSLKDILYKRMKLSGRLLRKAKKNKNIYVNKNSVSLSSKLRKGDVVTVIMEEEKNQFEPQSIPITVEYEDLDLLIINKQPRIVVHPTKGHLNSTIANGLANYLIETQQNFKIRFINRLDMDTSGLLMIAKNPFAQQMLSKQMNNNLVEKKYLAVVKGVVAEDFGTINAPIGLTDRDPIRRYVTMDGQDSITHFEVVKRFTFATLVRLTIETGRTHQIRVHMKYLGYPLIGDDLYGYVDENLINRQALHAQSLKFRQLRTNDPVVVTAELPEDIKSLIAKLENN